MYLSPRALDGSRRQRLAIGALLVLFMLLVAAGLTVVAVNGSGGGPWASAGFGAGAVSAYLLLWWSARHWYAAWSQGRRPDLVPEPGHWPWVPPPLLIAAAAAVTGVRALDRGDSGGWFSIGLAGLFGLLGLMGLGGVVLTGLSRRRSAAAGPAPVAEPPRPRRDWGGIG
ncbi:hypothetical protein [Streptomyces sp. NPDC048639]|uniref:hypothetical protein n=1 Tax=Streptomyces sp. NPDC048639 TaxID=3365581 RepID=UPI003720C57B